MPRQAGLAPGPAGWRHYPEPVVVVRKQCHGRGKEAQTAGAVCTHQGAPGQGREPQGDAPPDEADPPPLPLANHLAGKRESSAPNSSRGESINGQRRLPKMKRSRPAWLSPGARVPSKSARIRPSPIGPSGSAGSGHAPGVSKEPALQSPPPAQGRQMPNRAPGDTQRQKGYPKG
jgi:hypothetical protein